MLNGFAVNVTKWMTLLIHITIVGYPTNLGLSQETIINHIQDFDTQLEESEVY
ncbi:MAG TPA: hypothetical protein VL854_08565 [Nitrososphaeraceae archaeon]|nr:hypothetical protein [Nitrososphaeraceae archaeon]